MNRPVQWLVVLFLGLITVLLTIQVAQNGNSGSKAYAGDGTAMAGERFLIATGLVSTGESAAWILDGKNETLSVYRFRSGQALEYLGTRPIKFETQLKRPLGDRSRGEFEFDGLKKAWESQTQKDDGTDTGGK